MDIQIALAANECDEKAVSEATLESANNVEKFKDVLSTIQSSLQQYHDEKKAKVRGLEKLHQSYDDLLNMFASEARKIYPELRRMNVDQILGLIPNAGPLANLFARYESKFNAINQDITTKTEEYGKLCRLVEVSENSLKTVVGKYEDYFKKNKSANIPSTRKLLRDVEIKNRAEVVPTSKMLADVSVLDPGQPYSVSRDVVAEAEKILAVEESLQESRTPEKTSDIRLWHVLGLSSVFYILFARGK